MEYQKPFNKENFLAIYRHLEQRVWHELEELVKKGKKSKYGHFPSIEVMDDNYEEIAFIDGKLQLIDFDGNYASVNHISLEDYIFLLMQSNVE